MIKRKTTQSATLKSLSMAESKQPRFQLTDDKVYVDDVKQEKYQIEGPFLQFTVMSDSASIVMVSLIDNSSKL